jgi:excinuclease ABC subunit A
VCSCEYIQFDFLIQKEDQSKWLLLSPIHLEEKRTLAQQLNVLLQQGFQRIYANKKLVNISDVLN